MNWKNHVDTFAIVGTNVALIAIVLTLSLSALSRIDSTNARIDASNSRIDTILNELKEFNKRICGLESKENI